MNGICIRLVRLHQAFWRPIYRGMADRGVDIAVCRFQPTCSNYAIDALKKYPLSLACRKIFMRLLRCRAGCEGGHDPA